jgi:ribokinase
VVIGSLNIDYIASVERLPAAGETVPASKLIQRFGGKGANQAVAAARQGASVSLVGCVGADDNGRAYRRRLRDEGIDASAVRLTHRALTGTALIAVDRSAENSIIVAPGANGELTPAACCAAARLIRSASVVLLQFEIPMKTVTQAVRIANRAGVAAVLNPSPLRSDFPWGQIGLDTLIANELEAEAIFGLKVNSVRARLSSWREVLVQKRISRLVITRGAKTTLCIEAGALLEAPVLKVTPVDTVGAGDAFAGTFAARKASGLETRRAIRYANCAGALATLKPGAQESMPTRAATEKAFRRLG